MLSTRLAVLAALAFAPIAPAADPAPPAAAVRLPKPPAPPAPPAPAPAPAPDPAAALRLPYGLLYPVDADGPVLVLASPPGLVKVTRLAAPGTVYGRFVDSPTPDEPEFREFKGKSVDLVTPVKGAKGRVELFVIPAGAADESQVIRRLLDLGPADPVKPADPADPLFPAMQAAYAADPSPTKAADARQLAAVFRNAVPAAADPNLATAAALLQVVQASAAQLVPLPRLQGVREVVRGELDKKLPTAPAAPLDPAVRQAAADQFGRLAALYDALSK